MKRNIREKVKQVVGVEVTIIGAKVGSMEEDPLTKAKKNLVDQMLMGSLLIEELLGVGDQMVEEDLVEGGLVCS